MLRIRRLSQLMVLFALAVLTMQCKARNQANIKSEGLSTSTEVSTTPEASLSTPGDRLANWGDDTYLSKIQPLFAHRCAVCHGCTASPCNLKLDSYEGFLRGASAQNHYAVHLNALPVPVNAVGAPGFFPVGGANNSILAKLITQGNAVNKPGFNRDETETLRNRIDEDSTFECPATPQATDTFLSSKPGAGMPFGLPGLTDAELADVQTWLAAGAPGPTDANRPRLINASRKDVIFRWETFLNSPTPKGKLVGRYIYEHSFSAHYHFDSMPGEFFTLIRSIHAPSADDIAEPDEILTDLPTDAPNTGRLRSAYASGNSSQYTNPMFFYRFVKVKGIITRKNHIVWDVNDRVLDRLDDLFIKSDWQTNYGLNSRSTASDYTEKNPFEVFNDIPQQIRHRFMNENSRLIINAMVRAPVCNGEGATYAISDQFWVWFLKPESEVELTRNLRETLGLDVTRYTLAGQVKEKYDNNQAFIAAYETAVRAKLETERVNNARPMAAYNLDDLWYGDDATVEKRSPWLTVMRHQKSSTVHYGMAGGYPQALWVLTYPNFERLYYNLVVNFKYWGALKHKLTTWQSMSHERLNGEDSFLGFLPFGRTELRDEYAGGVSLPPMSSGFSVSGLNRWLFGGREVRRYIDLYPLAAAGRAGGVEINGDERADVIMARQVRDKMPDVIKATARRDILNSVGAAGSLESIFIDPPAGVVAPEASPNPASFEEFENGLRSATFGRGKGGFAMSLPDITYIRVDIGGEKRLYSLLRNRNYLSHNVVFGESSVAAPEKDTISIIRGAHGDFPQKFIDVEPSKLGAFMAQLAKLRGDEPAFAVNELFTYFGISRNSAQFWPFVDWLHANIAKMSDTGDGQTEEGILDLSRYDIY